MSTWQIDVTMGREFQNWYFSWILGTSNFKKKFFYSMSSFWSIDCFEFFDNFLAKKGQIYKMVSKNVKI
jgi:hypothetical protein